VKRFFFFLFLSVPILSFAQSNFQKGYIVNNSNDTLKGYVNYRERGLNPSSVGFKAQLNSEVQNFNIRECAAYGIDHVEYYQRFIVNITTSSVSMNSLSKGADLSFKRDTVLLKQLETGKYVALYTYRDHIKLRFYIKENNVAEPAELISQKYFKEDQSSVIVTGSTYIRQLQLIMDKYNPANESDKQKIRFLRYSETDLIKAVALINGQQPTRSSLSSSRFFAGTGLNINKGFYKGENDLAGANAIVKNSYTPLFTVGVDLFANPAIGKIIYRAELSFQMSKNEISYTDLNKDRMLSSSHSFDQFGLTLSPQVIYNIYNTSKLKLFLGAGAGINYSTYKNNLSTTASEYFFNGGSIVHEPETIKDAVEMEKLYFSIPVTAGVVLNKKIEISAGYTFPSTISNYQLYNVRLQRFKIGINYLFGQ
jgi:hypothetical protein